MERSDKRHENLRNKRSEDMERDSLLEENQTRLKFLHDILRIKRSEDIDPNISAEDPDLGRSIEDINDEIRQLTTVGKNLRAGQFLSECRRHIHDFVETLDELVALMEDPNNMWLHKKTSRVKIVKGKAVEIAKKMSDRYLEIIKHNAAGAIDFTDINPFVVLIKIRQMQMTPEKNYDQMRSLRDEVKNWTYWLQAKAIAFFLSIYAKDDYVNELPIDWVYIDGMVNSARDLIDKLNGFRNRKIWDYKAVGMSESPTTWDDVKNFCSIVLADQVFNVSGNNVSWMSSKRRSSGS